MTGVFGAADNQAPPTVSVAVLCYNHERYIEQCLDSVAAQTLGDLELIVMDDASTDGSREVIREWVGRSDVRCRVVENRVNLGLIGTLNAAIGLLNGRFAVLFAGDDWMESDRLERQVAFLEEASDRVMVVSGDVRLIDSDGHPIDRKLYRVLDDAASAESVIAPTDDEWGSGDQVVALAKRNWIQSPSATMRTEVFDVVGPYDESLPFEDLQLWLGLASRDFELAYLPGVVTNYRKHATSLTATQRAEIVDGKIQLLLQHLGHSAAADREIWRTVAWHAHFLHTHGFEPSRTRAYLRRAAIHRPTRWMARAVLESHLRLKAGAFALRRSG